jgi:hypothetical protein
MTKLLLLVALAACGSRSSSSAESPPQAKAVLPDVPFDDLDHDQRAEFMKQKVVPAMEPIFKKHDPAHFSEFGCKTCHGKQAAEGLFDMPSADLPKLTFKDMSKFKKEDIEWMKNEVKPTMAKLLARTEFGPEFGPDNPNGFGCQSCHFTE